MVKVGTFVSGDFQPEDQYSSSPKTKMLMQYYSHQTYLILAFTRHSFVYHSATSCCALIRYLHMAIVKKKNQQTLLSTHYPAAGHLYQGVVVL